MLFFFQILQLLSALFLTLLVLLHSPKGEGLASIGGAANAFSSQKGLESGLNKLTTIIAITFMITSILLGFGVVK